jgi:protein gp37
VFTPSMSDPFHHNVKEEWLDQFIATAIVTPHIQYQVLTKRAKGMHEYFENFDVRRLIPFVRKANDKRHDLTDYRWKLPIPNLHLGVSVENQAAADERIPWLIKTPAEVRFLSMEPLIEPVFLGRQNLKHISWVIIGGESGPNARPFNLEWARSLRDQCQEAGVKYFLKQLGSNPWDKNQKLKLQDRKGGNIEEWPENLRIREVL